MTKRIFTILSIMVVVSLALAACGPQATEAPTEPPATEVMEEPEATEPPVEPEGLPIGIVLPTRDEPRWIQDETRFNDALAEAGYEAEILFSEGDSSRELANVQNLITQGVEVIIITPHDATAAAAAAEAAHDAGVKIISYDRLIRETDAVDYYVTFDSVAVGAAQGQYLVDQASGTDNPLYLYAGAASDNNAFLFFEGAWGVLQPKVADGTFYIVNSSEAVALQDTAELTREEMAQIIGQITTEWDFNTAKNLAEANLTAASAEDKGDVFILAPNDGTARAIADAFAADADVDSYVVTGQDAEVASVQYIIDGKQSMTVLKDVRTLVSDAINAAVAYLEGGEPPVTNTYDNGVIEVPASPSEVIAVDQSNVQAAIIESGYWPASEFTGLEEMGEEEAVAGVPEECTDNPDESVCAVFAPGETIAIGYAGPITGDYAAFGTDISQGGFIAIQDFGDFGDWQFELLAEDTQGSGEGGAAVANLFVSNPDVVAIAGHTFSGSTAAAIPIYNEARLPMLSPSATRADLTQGDQDVFNRIPFTDDIQGTVAAEYLYNQLGVTQLAVMHDGDAYGQGLAEKVRDVFGELGGEAVAFQAITPGETDYSAPLTQIAAQSPEAIYFGGYYAEAAVIVSQMAVAGMPEAFVFSDDGVFGASFIELAGDDAEGTYAASALPPSSEAKDAFEAAYLDEYGIEAGSLSTFTWHGYDVVAALISVVKEVAIESGDGNLYVPREAMVEAVRNLQGYQGLTGEIGCNETGECNTAGPTFFVVQDGEWVEAE